jgi:hypothetical protein
MGRSSRLAPQQSPKQCASGRMLRKHSSSTYKTDSTSLHTPIHQMRTHRSLTPSRARHHQSAHHARKLVPLLLAPRRSHRCTSASTRRCCTTLSTATSARCTLVTCTVLLCSCTRCLVTLRTRKEQSCSGAAQTQGVCQHECSAFRPNTNHHRPRQCRLHPCMLHGPHSVVATSPCPGTHRTDGPTLHAFP